VRVFGDRAPDAQDGVAYTTYGPRDRELALWQADAVTPDEVTGGAEPRTVVHRLRHAGALRRQ
jgi:para-nitrobenzyl esterase